jgi:hypothetical protein
MGQLGFTGATKEEGLREFQRRGWILVDATYEPVNKLNPSGRDWAIERDYPLLRDDLTELMPNRSTPLVLIKANVCRILEPKLLRDGFNVLNRGAIIPFPSSGRQTEFRRQFATILRIAGLRSAAVLQGLAVEAWRRRPTEGEVDGGIGIGT